MRKHVEVLNETDWAVAVELEEGIHSYPVYGLAYSFDDGDSYLILRSMKPHSNGRYDWYICMFGFNEINDRIMYSPYSLPVVIESEDNIHKVVMEFNRIANHLPALFHARPIQELILKTQEEFKYNEDGEHVEL